MSKVSCVAVLFLLLLPVSAAAQPDPCAAERKRLAVLNKELQALQSRPHKPTRPKRIEPDTPPEPDVDREAIDAWHEAHDAEVNSLRRKLQSAACGGAPNPVPPDLGFQVALCLDRFNSSSHPNLREEVKENLTKFLAVLKEKAPDQFPDPHVDSQCVNNRETGGLWRARGADLSALNRLSIIPEGSTFAFQFFSDALSKATWQTWAALPKRIDTSGNRDPNGPLELKTYKLTFKPPDQVILEVHGTYHSTADVDFTASYTDHLSLSNGTLQCRTERKLNVDADWVETLFAIFIPFPVSYIPLDLVHSAIESLSPPSRLGVGCLAAGALPGTLLLPRKGDEVAQKLVFPYDTVKVDPSVGLLVSGVVPPNLRNREPKVGILGPRTVVVRALQGAREVKARFYAATSDMRGQISAKWAATRGTILTEKEYVEIQYPAPGREVGTRVAGGTVSVQVMDEDGLSASASLSVTIEVKEDLPPPKKRTISRK